MWNMAGICRRGAIFPNHYHFVGTAEKTPDNLSTLIRRLHGSSSVQLKRIDEKLGRKVWFQYWDTRITTQKAYFARLHYVHQNPVKHGIVPVAAHYPWCSARWFEAHAEAPFYRMVTGFRVDRVSVVDDFEVEL
jgi:putative transposase